MARSIEEKVENWCKDQLKGLFKIKTEPINQETEDALKKYPSKQGGRGTNYPDLKMLIQKQGRNIPVMIEVKGTKGALVKLNTETNTPDNLKKDGTPNFQNIAKYAVNGAVHYADAILELTKSYKEVVAVGVNGIEQKDGTTIYEIGVWYVSKDNLFVPKEVAKFSDLSFLQPQHQADFLRQIDLLKLSEQEIEREKLKLEDDIERKIKALNEKMEKESEYQIDVNQRVQLVTGLIMAGLGVEGKVSPLQVEDLRGDNDKYNNDGAIIMRKIHSYLEEKGLPPQKIEMINNVLYGVFIDARLHKAEDGESKLKKIYIYTQENIIPFLTGELHNLDFTGRMFNAINEWVAAPDGGANDVVLTPRYVTELMAKLCQVNKDSYVWDFATGSAGFLISAMHQMIADAKATIESPEELRRKINHIKMEQLLGIEILGNIYMLAVLNMILMKDGSANIIHGNSLTEFDGNYSQGAREGEEFPANVFLLNPPYSAEGKGFIFVERAFNMMHRGGRAAILIQENAGSTQGLPYTQRILQNNTLLASIKMSDIFCGKATVQTAIYVFEIGRPHKVQDVVKFIDFSEDGYTRQNRKHSSQSVNLRDTDNAKERYEEVATLVNFGRGVNDENLHYYKDCYVEDHITLDGNDWTYSQHRKINTNPTAEDFGKVVKDYLAWRVAEFIKAEDGLGKSAALGFADCSLTDNERTAINNLAGGVIRSKSVRIGDLFDIYPTLSYGQTNATLFATKGKVPVIVNSSANNGVGGWVALEPKEKGNMITFSDTTTSDAIFYQPLDFIGYSHVQGLHPKKEKPWNENTYLYFLTLFKKAAFGRFDYATKFTRYLAMDMQVAMPLTSDGGIDYGFMELYISAVKKQVIQRLKDFIACERQAYLQVIG